MQGFANIYQQKLGWEMSERMDFKGTRPKKGHNVSQNLTSPIGTQNRILDF